MYSNNSIIRSMIKFNKGLNAYSLLDLEEIIKDNSTEDNEALYSGDFSLEIKDQGLVKTVTELISFFEEFLNKDIKGNLGEVIKLYNICFLNRIEIIADNVLNYLYMTDVRNRFKTPLELSSTMVDSVLESKECFDDNLNKFLFKEIPLTPSEFGEICFSDNFYDSPVIRDMILSTVMRKYDINKFLNKIAINQTIKQEEK